MHSVHTPAEGVRLTWMSPYHYSEPTTAVYSDGATLNGGTQCPPSLTRMPACLLSLALPVRPAQAKLSFYIGQTFKDLMIQLYTVVCIYMDELWLEYRQYYTLVTLRTPEAAVTADLSLFRKLVQTYGNPKLISGLSCWC